MKTCTKDGCNRKHRARGLCGTHYNQAHAADRHAKKMTPCTFCGKGVMKGGGTNRIRRATCSNECRQWLSTPYCKLPADHWARWYGKASSWAPPKITMTVAERGKSQRSKLRIAIEDGRDILGAISSEAATNTNGCWVWGKGNKDGYPTYNMALKSGKVKVYRVHRLSLEAKMGRPLGKQAAHHTCANTMCVNPDHLQPISFRENTAEMMQRNYYINRIKALEEALSVAVPAHPLLQEVSLPPRDYETTSEARGVLRAA